MGEPKTGLMGNREIHYSVGILLQWGDSVLMIDRNTPPYGWAGIAGHVDAGEEPDQAIVREVWEETGLTLTSLYRRCERFISWNECSRGVTGHFWHLFMGTAEGHPVAAPREVKAIAWRNLLEIEPGELEDVWRYWFKELGLI